MAYNGKGLTLTAGLNYRRSVDRTGDSSLLQLPDPATGALTPAHQSSMEHLRGDTLTLNGGVDYDVTSQDRLSATLNHVQDRLVVQTHGDYRSDAVSGPLDLAYVDAGTVHAHYSDNAGSGTWLRKLPGEGHELSLSLNLDQNHTIFSFPTQYSYSAPSESALFEGNTRVLDIFQTDLKAEYKAPLPNKAKLVTGYELQIDQTRLGSYAAFGDSGADAVISLAESNLSSSTSRYTPSTPPMSRYSVP